MQCQSCHWWRDIYERIVSAMTATIIFLLAVSAIGFVVDHHHRGNRDQFVPADDRDTERVRIELSAANAHADDQYRERHGPARTHFGGSPAR